MYRFSIRANTNKVKPYAQGSQCISKLNTYLTSMCLILCVNFKTV